MDIHVLGCSGGIGQGLGTTSLRVGENTLLDCGTGIFQITLLHATDRQQVHDFDVVRLLIEHFPIQLLRSREITCTVFVHGFFEHVLLLLLSDDSIDPVVNQSRDPGGSHQLIDHATMPALFIDDQLRAGWQHQFMKIFHWNNRVILTGHNGGIDRQF